MNHIDRAAEVLNQSVVRQSVNDDIFITVYVDGLEFEETLARALDAAGLLASEGRDREVAARAWDEGHKSASREVIRGGHVKRTRQPNPYRAGGE